MKALQDFELFVRTADLGSLSAAARVLDVSPAVASAALKRLEAELGAPLFVRSTRSLRLTPEGENLLTRCRPLLDELREFRDEVQAGHSLVRGELSLSMPSGLGRHVILPWLDEFQARHPELRLRVQLSDRRADVYREPVDVAIRYGTPAESNMIAMPLVAENHRVLCAAPQYLNRHGTPTHPAELARHNCLCFRIDDTLYDRWRFVRGREALEVEVRGNRSTDDADAVRHWALAGHGIGYRSWLDTAQDVVAGRLRVLCPDWLGDNVPLNLIYADRRQRSPTLRLLREHLSARFDTFARSRAA